jgi:WD40 repeat protein
MKWSLIFISTLLAGSLTGVAVAQTERIVFSSTADGSFDLFAIDPNGSNPVNLTQSSAHEWDPAVSPDGARIAFSRRDQGRTSSDIWVMAANGTAQERLNKENDPPHDRDPAWSPDGQWLAWTRSEGGPEISQIWIMRPNGSGKQAITDDQPGIYEHSPAWSPAGQRIAFVSNRGKGFTDIWVMQSDGSNRTRLTHTDGKIEGHPAWSPDGTTIAYECRRPRKPMAICVMDANGNGESKLTQTKGYEAQPSWSRDGGSLVYTHAPAAGGDKDLVVINADGTGRSNITSSPRIDFEPSWGLVSAFASGPAEVAGPISPEGQVSASGGAEPLLVTKKVTKVAPGVKFLKQRYQDSNVFVVRFKPGFKPTLDVALGGNTLAGRQRVSTMAKQAGAVAAINADFPLPSGRPAHPFAQDGDLKNSSFVHTHNFAMAVNEDEAFLDVPWQLLKTKEQDSGDEWTFDRWNFGPPTAAEIAAFSPPGGAEEQPPRFTCSTRLDPAGGRRWAPLRRGVVRPFKVEAARCSVKRMDRQGGVVLSAQPATDGAFLLETLRPGEKTALTWFFGGWRGVADSVGGWPVLMDEGQVVAKDCPSQFCDRHPRSGIGVTARNVTLLVVADGRSPNSAGLTLVQFGQLFKELGAKDAVNFDGGGSSTLVVKGKVRNEPSDGKERPICCAVLVLPGKDGQEDIGPAATLSTSAIPSTELIGGGSLSLVDPGSTGGMLDAMARGAFGADPSTLTAKMWSAVRTYREAS